MGDAPVRGRLGGADGSLVFLENSPLIYVFGSINLALVLHVPRFPEPGEMIPAGELLTLPSGKGANQAVAAARSSDDPVKVRMIGAVGEDIFGKYALDGLISARVDLEFVKLLPTPTGIATIMVRTDGENMGAYSPGANQSLGSDMKGLSDIGEKDIIILQGEVPGAANRTAVLTAARKHTRIIMNLSPFFPIEAATLRYIDYLIINEEEAVAYCKDSGCSPEGTKPSSFDFAVSAAESFWKRYKHQMIVTLGLDGAVTVGKDGVEEARSERTTVIDTVGAGDCFTGVFAVAIHEGLSPTESMERAVTAATISVSREGAQASMPSREEIETAHSEL